MCACFSQSVPCVPGARRAQVSKNGSLKLIDHELSKLPSWLEDSPRTYGSAVRTLVLKANLFKIIPDLRALEKLTELNLNGNELKSVDAHGLPPSVERLDLVNNQISRVDASFFSSLSKLSRVDLHGNHLTAEGLEEVCIGPQTNGGVGRFLPI